MALNTSWKAVLETPLVKMTSLSYLFGDDERKKGRKGRKEKIVEQEEKEEPQIAKNPYMKHSRRD